MAATTDMELENQLAEAGKKLNPPSTVDELLNPLEVDQQKMPEQVGSDDVLQASQKKVPEKAECDEATVSDDAPQVADELKPEVTPAVAQTGNSDSLIGLDYVEKKECFDSVTQLTKDEPNITSEIVNSETNEPNLNSEIVHSETNELNVNSEISNLGKKTGDQKPNSLLHSAEASGNSRMDTDKEAGEHAEERKSHSEEANNSPSQDQAVDEATVLSENEKKTPTQLTSPSECRDETVKAGSASPSLSLPDRTRYKKGQQEKNKRASNQDSDPGLSSVTKGAFLNGQTQVEDEPPPSADVISKKETKRNKDSEEKQRAHSGGKVKANEDETPQPVDDISMKESGPASESEDKPLRRSGKKAVENTSKEDEFSLDKQEVIKKKGRGKNKSKKDVTGEQSSMENVSSPRTTKSSSKVISHLEESPNTKPKRKRTPGKEVVSETPNSDNDHDEDLVGSKIKVWWPLDKMFYEGTVGSFDSVKKKHKVLYVDGDVEVLNLRKERWEYVEEDNVPEREGTGHPSPDSSEMPQKKKAKADLDSSTLQTKRNSSAKRGGGSSTSRSRTNSDSRSKDKALNSAGKSKEDSSDKSMDEPPKSGGKRKREEVQKCSSKAKDDETSTKLKEEKDVKSNDKKDDKSKAKEDDKSKDGTTKTSSKLKEDVSEKRGGKVKVKEDDTPKTSSSKQKGGATPNINTSNKSTANGGTSAAKKGKSGSSSKVQESRDSSSKDKSAKAEESETNKSENKAQESETKSGRKGTRKARRS